MKRLWTALAAYAVIAALAWTTLTEPRFRLAVLALMTYFAVRSFTQWRRQQLETLRESKDLATTELATDERE